MKLNENKYKHIQIRLSTKYEVIFGYHIAMVPSNLAKITKTKIARL